MMVLYREHPFPKCKYCGIEMDYWVPGQRDEDAAHDDCAAEQFANEFVKSFPMGAQSKGVENE